MQNNNSKTKPYNNTSLGIRKHYPVAIKEWSNNVYAFDPCYIKDSYNSVNLADRVIKSYFNMDKKSLSTKSKRMRDLLKRSSTKQIFVSKSLIKQTNDKAIINVFMFDRLKKKYNKKLFFLKNDLNHVLSSNVTKKGKMLRKQYGKTISKYRFNTNTYPKLLNSTLLNKKHSIKTLFFFYFLKWSLSAFNLKVNFLKRGDKILQGNLIHIINSDTIVMYSYKNNITRITRVQGTKSLYLDPNSIYKLIPEVNSFTINNIRILNDILYKYLYIIMSKSIGENQIRHKIYLLFRRFKNRYNISFIRKYMRKEYITLNYLYKLYLNKIRINELLPGLKYILSQIFNKKVELNIINLKYLHLNSDIFTSAIIVKLRKKTSKLLRVLKKSLKLVKIPIKTRIDNTVKNNTYNGININNVHCIYGQPSNSNRFIKDKLNSTINNMFVDNREPDLHDNLLTSLKYKWITGARLEAKGRLTKRFTASRSLFKFKYKGNLKDMDYLNRSVGGTLSGVVNVSGAYLIRNAHKPNIQYTSTNSKKRIGTFGIKGWISNN